ncbi:hypothetical protein LUZ61_007286 [Rhynchospora tenuis]|uniref:Alpha-carbonic anhydrase domain-containing protein n=1 Tax=Rhynchospora tenuis TaxID=198213 RepID=A0AAD5ZT78_9POAL|nr:hypothetical protein LUZ61_007286 [Rhynchospora tenuis]
MASYKVFFALAIISSLVALCCAHKSPTGNAQEFVKFSYSGSLGPENWASLSSAFELCGKGSHQSPINIDCKAAVHDSSLQCLKRDYVAANATLVNNGFNIGLVYTSEAGSLVISGKKYSLKHLRWHSPSEHTLDGERFPFEVNLIHESKDGNVAIVSILYRYGNADPFLLQITDKLDQLAKASCSEDQEARISAGLVHSRSLKLSTRKYYRYVGSLTTPPCTENVVWNILSEVRTLSKEQGDALRAPLVGDYQKNSRPIQPLNGRVVQVYDKVTNVKTN